MTATLSVPDVQRISKIGIDYDADNSKCGVGSITGGAEPVYLLTDRVDILALTNVP